MDESLPTWEPRTPNVEIDTDFFSASVIPLNALPGEFVANTLATPGPQGFAQMVQLFKLAINDPEDMSTFGILNYSELCRVIEQWLFLSNEIHQQPLDEDPDEAVD